MSTNKTWTPLKLIAESPEWVVIDKPAGLLSVPAERGDEASVLSVLARQFPRQKHIPVHRLDRQTSGVLLVARTQDFHRRANQWFSDRLVKKEYLVLAEGNPTLPALKLDSPIEGKKALSQVQLLERFTVPPDEADPEISVFLARVRIATGRRHQIRIHLQKAGFPVLGDPLYGGRKKVGKRTIDRVALHAERLVLPKDLPQGDWTSPLPDDFQSWIQSWRREGVSS